MSGLTSSTNSFFLSAVTSVKACLHKMLFEWTTSGSDNFVESPKTNCNFAVTDEANELFQQNELLLRLQTYKFYKRTNFAVTDGTNDLLQQSKEFINQMIQKEHLEPVPSETLTREVSAVFYLPLHHVTKESTTTNLRVVFDASAKSSSGLSLNDILFVGSAFHDNLFSILLRFRMHRTALSADITKMFRQVGFKR